MDISDAVLVKMCLDGRRESYEELIRRYQHSVYNLAYRMTNSPADADDITQETFVRAYEKLRKYNSAYSFKNWLLAICANLTKNMFRKRMRRQEIEQSYFELEHTEERESGDYREQLERALDQLPANLRAPLILKYTEGCSIEEIGKILKIGISAAKMRIKRGRDELMRMMQKKLETGN